MQEIRIKSLKGRAVTCSIGIACYPHHGRSYMELFKCADKALYETKSNGRNGYTMYREKI